MNERRLPWAALLALFALAFGLRAVALVQYEREHPQAQRPTIDEASYDSWAREIAGGELVGKEIFFQEPLYPYVLGGVYALAGDEPAAQRNAARWMQVAAGALAAALTGSLAARLFGRNAGWIAGALVALHRPAIWFPALLLKENLFVTLLAALALGLVATREFAARGWTRRESAAWLALGLIAGLGALLRGNLLVMLPLLALWPLGRALARRDGKRRALLHSSAFVAGAFLALLPVLLRNHAVGGRFVLTTSGAGTNFYGGNNLDNPFGVATEFDWVRGIPEHEAGDWRREASRRAGRELDPKETSDFWLETTLASMREQPGEHALILLRKLRLTLGRYEVPDNHFLEWDALYVPMLEAPLPGFALVGTLGLAGLVVLLLARRRAEEDGVADGGAALELALLGGAYLGTVVLTVTSERIRMPLVPLLAVFAGGLVPLAATARRRLLIALPALAACAGLVLTPVLPAGELERDLDERDYNLAVALLEENDENGARAIVELLATRHSASPRVQLLAAELDYRRARRALDTTPQGARMPASAGADIEAALRKLEGVARRGNAQERFRADLLAGAIRQYLGQWAEAEANYRSALAFDGEDRDLRRRLAVVIAEQAMAGPAGEPRAA
ncbi:MAG: glycosyltransferase family 39 protein, partial [Planctomycetota bacterium]|nr:glycosyltransferase family 39 protein [Planctomycetota bacterium]